jgi:hypothetical protein
MQPATNHIFKLALSDKNISGNGERRPQAELIGEKKEQKRTTASSTASSTVLMVGYLSMVLCTLYLLLAQLNLIHRIGRDKRQAIFLL